MTGMTARRKPRRRGPGRPPGRPLGRPRTIGVSTRPIRSPPRSPPRHIAPYLRALAAGLRMFRIRAGVWDVGHYTVSVRKVSAE